MSLTSTKKLSFRVNGERLVGIISSHNKDIPSFLFLHGSGRNYGKDATLYLIEKLQDFNKSIFSFDFSGCGESTGKFRNSSLKKRLHESKQAMKLFSQTPSIICATSMSGYIGLKLLNTFEIETLILFCPAIYDKTAFDVAFNNDFTDIIRKKESWKNSDIFSSLEKFTGNLLIIIGENDTVIPEEVINLIDKHSINTNKKEIIRIPHCPHNIHPWLSKNPKVCQQIAEKISEFLK